MIFKRKVTFKIFFYSYETIDLEDLNTTVFKLFYKRNYTVIISKLIVVRFKIIERGVIVNDAILYV